MSYWTDKVALITGGSRGLGRSIAQAFVQAGAHVILTARDQEQLAETAQSLSSSDRACGWLPADITQADQVQALVAQALQMHGRLDVLVNCAGQSDRGLAAETPVQRFRELLELNFLSTVNVTQAALPHLVRSQGHVVLIGSLAAKVAGRHLGAYPASKFPLAAFAQQLRLELGPQGDGPRRDGPQGLHSLLVCPGPIRRDDAGTRYDTAAAGLPESARKPGGGVKLSGLDPDWLAGQILWACERRKAELVVPAKAKLLFALAQLSPGLGDWLITKMTR